MFDRDNQCDKCGCSDVMDKKEYDILCYKFKSATDKEKEELRQSEEYSIICKYKFIVDAKNTPEERLKQSEHDKELYARKLKQNEQKITEMRERVRRRQSEQARIDKEQNVPKCPTCGSTNVHPISSGKKALGFITVGVFSSNFGKTMECKNCGYKW